MKPLILFASLLTAVASDFAAAADDISTWRAVVLDKPFHAGDSKLRAMGHRQPQGERFTGKFQLPAAIRPGVATFLYANLEVAGVLPMREGALSEVRKQHSLGTCVRINGQHAAILNEYAKEGSNARFQKLSIRIPGDLLRPGENEIQVVPGRRSQIDDIELRSVTVSSRAE